MRLHLLGAPDGTIRAVILASADQKERDVARRLFGLTLRGGETIVCDKGYAGAEFAAHAANSCGATVLRPARKTEPANGLHLSGIRQRIESIFWTLKDQLGLEAHRARTLHGLRARIATKLLAYSAGIWLNWLLGRPPHLRRHHHLTKPWHQPSSGETKPAYVPREPRGVRAAPRPGITSVRTLSPAFGGDDLEAPGSQISNTSCRERCLDPGGIRDRRVTPRD
jgi:DDE family transposase